MVEIDKEVLEKCDFLNWASYPNPVVFDCTVLTKDEYNQKLFSYYNEFLLRTDYIVIKLSEAKLVGRECRDDYSKVIEAREIAREQIRIISESTK